MTRLTRTRLLILALLPAAAIGAISCSDSPSAPQATGAMKNADPEVALRLARLHAANDWVGDYHNRALQYVFEVLKAQPVGKRDGRTVCETAIAAYRQFHRANRHSEVPSDVEAAAEAGCRSGTGFSFNNLAFSISTPAAPSRDAVSVAAQSYLDQIVTAVNSSDTESDLAATVSSIETNAARSLSESEAGAVVIVGSVAQSSMQYWDANLQYWDPYLTAPLDQSRIARSSETADGGLIAPAHSPRFGFWSDFKSAAKVAAIGDVKGAIGAVVRAGILGIGFEYEVIIGGAAVASILAVLQM